MKYSQTNTEPSYTPRKPTGGSTQQSAQPEPQNSAGTWHGEVTLGREKAQEGRCFCEWREDGDWERENTGKAPLPKSRWRESGKLETAAGTKLKYLEANTGCRSLVYLIYRIRAQGKIQREMNFYKERKKKRSVYNVGKKRKEKWIINTPYTAYT